jgi:hypothetical protein
MGNAENELEAIRRQAKVLFGPLGCALHTRYRMLIAKQGGTES